MIPELIGGEYVDIKKVAAGKRIRHGKHGFVVK
jgi:hypothetical protein